MDSIQFGSRSDFYVLLLFAFVAHVFFPEMIVLQSMLIGWSKIYFTTRVVNNNNNAARRMHLKFIDPSLCVLIIENELSVLMKKYGKNEYSHSMLNHNFEIIIF